MTACRPFSLFTFKFSCGGVEEQSWKQRVFPKIDMLQVQADQFAPQGSHVDKHKLGVGALLGMVLLAVVPHQTLLSVTKQSRLFMQVSPHHPPPKKGASGKHCVSVDNFSMVLSL
jgi:hypothetical protein